MDSLTLFLLIFAIGTGFIALWVVADVSRRLTKQTQAALAEAEADMVRIIQRNNRNQRVLNEKIGDLQLDMAKMKKDHAKEMMRLKTVMIEAEHKRNLQKMAANSY